VTDPPKYPRVPHVSGGSNATSDDVIWAAAGADPLAGVEVIVEEKLDGANVSIWFDGGMPRVGMRGGADTADRGGLRGRVRAWAAEHAVRLADVLGDSLVLYGEWLLVRHSVAYDALPGPLVGIDVFDREAGVFLDPPGRDAVLHAAGVPVPPRIFAGTVDSLPSITEMVGRSAFGSARAEGLIIRPVHGGPGLPRVLKFVDPAWARRPDEAWRIDETNRIAEPSGE
jgi:hypothetical protein